MSMSDCSLAPEIDAVVGRIGADLGASSPVLAGQVLRWIRRISPGGEPAAHFLDVRMFPILALPDFVLESLAVAAEAKFHKSLISSTVHGYYYIRLIDGIVDGDRDFDLERKILPVAGYFLSEFQLGYQKHFSAEHEFWQVFRRLWRASAASTAEDAMQRAVGFSEFERVSSRKFSAAGIPVAATCHRYGRADLLPAWLELVDGLGRWSQMADDILDWHQDRSLGRATYFLTEGERQRRCNEPLEEWILREGCDWGFDLLNEWMNRLQESAAQLGSPGLMEYLAGRKAWAAEQHSALSNGLAELACLAVILGQATQTKASCSAGTAITSAGAQQTTTISKPHQKENAWPVPPSLLANLSTLV
jgi:hypothetical protein